MKQGNLFSEPEPAANGPDEKLGEAAELMVLCVTSLLLSEAKKDFHWKSFFS